MSWKIEKSEKHAHTYYIHIPKRLNDAGEMVENTLYTQKKSEADLLAAAPETLVQLQNAATLLQWFFDDPKKFEASVHTNLIEIKEQIAKARGKA